MPSFLLFQPLLWLLQLLQCMNSSSIPLMAHPSAVGSVTAHHFSRCGSAPKPKGSNLHASNQMLATADLTRNMSPTGCAGSHPKSPAMLPSKCAGGVKLGNHVGLPAAARTTTLLLRAAGLAVTVDVREASRAIVIDR
jgi:hypothetical protein